MPRTCTICANPQHPSPGRWYSLQGRSGAFRSEPSLRVPAPARATCRRSCSRLGKRNRRIMLTASWRSSRASGKSPGDTCLGEGTGDLRSALAALRELRGTVELTAKLTPGPMAGQGAQGSQGAQHRPYKDVSFEELVALVEKLDRLKEGGVVVAERKVIDN